MSISIIMTTLTSVRSMRCGADRERRDLYYLCIALLIAVVMSCC
jgi:hypothetical protein